METPCSTQRLMFQDHVSRQVVAAFDGGSITSDAGGLLLREVDDRFTKNITVLVARCRAIRHEAEMENRIKEQQLYLFADRTSTHSMRSNQLRLLFSTMAYLLHVTLRQSGLAGTEMAKAQAGTIRTRLLKIGARIQVSVRRVVISISESYPHQDLFDLILANLRRACPAPLQI